MSVLTSPKTYAALAAFQAGDAVACAIALPIAKILDNLGVPGSVRPVLPWSRRARLYPDRDRHRHRLDRNRIDWARANPWYLKKPAGDQP
jgi:hypothetical protein